MSHKPGQLVKSDRKNWGGKIFLFLKKKKNYIFNDFFLYTNKLLFKFMKNYSDDSYLNGSNRWHSSDRRRHPISSRRSCVLKVFQIVN